MSATTTRYAIQYPTGDDPISGVATDLRTLATTVENALGNVDDRHTDGAGKPVSRRTLAELNRVSSPAGYAGYVTADSTTANNGYYISNGSTWIKYQKEHTTHTIQIAMPYMSGKAELTRIGNTVILNGILYGTGTYSSGNTVVNESIPAGYRPTVNAVIQGFSTNNKVFWTEADNTGKMTLWGNIDTNWRYSLHGSWTTTDTEPNE